MLPVETPNVLGSSAPTEIIMYTTAELWKIRISGAILVIAVLLITYYLYMLSRARYETWLRNKEIEEKIDAGQLPESFELPPIKSKVDRRIMFVAGGLLMIIGIIQVVM